MKTTFNDKGVDNFWYEWIKPYDEKNPTKKKR